MPIPIYDGQGKTVGWLDGDIVRDVYGQYRAFIRNGNVFTYSAIHIGTLSNGYFRDRHGDAAAFINGAHNGPLAPLTALPQLPPLFQLAPIPPIPPVPPVPPVPSLNWSVIDWEEFLEEKY